jgi:primosomal protein N' (replication factor Y)
VSADATTGALVDVVLDVPVDGTFTYRLPDALREAGRVGARVYVPFRGRPRTGVIVAPRTHSDLNPARIESVLDVLDHEPTLPEPLVALLDWTARYYLAPPGEVLRLLLPKPLRSRGKLVASITTFGRRCLHNGLVPEPAARAALEVLDAAARATDEAALRKAVRGLTLAGLRAMEARELLVLEDERPDPGQGKVVVHWLRRSGDPPPGRRLGAKQAAVLELLEGREQALEAEIREQTGASLSTLRSLEAAALVSRFTEERYRDPFADEGGDGYADSEVTVPVVRPSAEQAAALRLILRGEGGEIDLGQFRSVLLHGITGSGKTLVYQQAVAAALDTGRRALLLLPEIALTPQFVGIFRAAFGDAIAVLHSALTDGERYDQWRRIRRGEVSVVIGARSAVFAPIAELGLIIVDEEHDGSFKQDVGVRYNARDLALVRGRNERAVVVLGSATPSLESLQRAREGRCAYAPMRSRPTGQPLPAVELVDMRAVEKDASTGRAPLLSPRLRQSLEETRAEGEQAILLLNRRGHSTAVLCGGCGEGWRCPHCEIALTYHRGADRLRCHYCDYAVQLPERCPTCASPEWVFVGAGTEKLEHELSRALEGFRVLRLDRDTASHRNLRQIIGQFRRHEADVLVGTQMVAKGHDFPNVTMVGVIGADQALRLPDFRCGERTFQLLAQVAGRAGRREVPGRVLIQTFLPEHPIIDAATRHDYDAMADYELRARADFDYPPFGHVVAVRIEGGERSAVRQVVAHAKRWVEELTRHPDLVGVRALGPVEAPLHRLRDVLRWQILVRGTERPRLRRFVAALTASLDGAAARDVAVVVDVDPMFMM